MTRRKLALLVGGCVILGLGVGMILTADLGSDGYSTLVHGVAIASGLPFWVANILCALAFISLAAVRKLRPGPGTVVQVVVVGVVVTVLLQWISTPATVLARAALLCVALLTLATGVALYLGSHTGAGPAEGVGLAWDPPLPFKWSYSLVQFGGSLVGWLLGATVGPATIAVILILGPLVDLISRRLRLDVHQGAPLADQV